MSASPTTTKSRARPAFEVDKEGLAKLLARRGQAFAVTELISNSWDEATTRVDVSLERHREPGFYRLTVADDNPEGFADLAHAYTLFAESLKKGDATKRGRFNLGEKLVIAVCTSATLLTTKGRIDWSGDKRVHKPECTDAGSRFVGVLPMSDADAAEVERVVHTLLPPHGIETTFNGVVVAGREPLRTFEASLRTELSDDEGRVRPTTRKTNVAVYEVRDGETGHLYELGIPVVETGDRFHVDVAQKVPLNMDRDNVPPGYLRDVRAHVLNATAELVAEAGGAADRWVNDALEDERVDPEAVRAIVVARYGENPVTADPSDREAEKRAIAEGHTLIPGGAFSKAAWDAVRASGVALPAGQVTPTLRPDDGDLEALAMDPAHYPANVASVVRYARCMGRALLGRDVSVRVVNAPQLPLNAAFAPRGRTLTLNFGCLGYQWFEAATPRVDALLIHEFAHDRVDDHLSHEMYDECCRLGARLLEIHRDNPATLDEYDDLPLAVAVT